MNAVARAIRVAQSVHRQLAGVKVAYVAGDVTLEVQATIGQTTFKVTDEYGLVTTVESRDFIIASEALVAPLDTPIEPAAGHFVRETLEDGTVHIHQVAAPQGREVWRWHDPYRQARRIHTVRVETQPAT